MYVTLVFDVEDVYYPPETGIDDIPGWLAEIMTEEGVRGTFFVMGEKAESMRQRGRQDVLDRMAQHDIGSHQPGNRYPFMPQIVEGKGWQDGIDAIRPHEDWVQDQLRQAFGKDPVAFSRHNAYFAPQHVALGGERGLPYAYLVSQIPGSNQPAWYAGAVTLPLDASALTAGLDRTYSCDAVFEPRFEAVKAAAQDCVERGDEFAIVFACHPVQVMAGGWLESHTLTTGRSRTPEELGWRHPVKSKEEEAVAKVNFRRLCRYLTEHPDLEVIGIEEAGRLFSGQPEQIPREALRQYADDILRDDSVPFHSTFSPAEMLCALADSLIHADDAGDLPAVVSRRDVLGPTERPVVAQEMNTVEHRELVAACRQAIAHIEAQGILPANVNAGAGRLGVGQLLRLAATSYATLADGEQCGAATVPKGPRYPAVAHDFDDWIRRHIADHWALPLDFSCEAMAEHARLQTWSMKPAWLNPLEKAAAGV